jgi:hypothetical protein
MLFAFENSTYSSIAFMLFSNGSVRLPLPLNTIALGFAKAIPTTFVRPKMACIKFLRGEIAAFDHDYPPRGKTKEQG